jgi:predicted RNase H-like nuclease (RuvC/YqgF family)
MTISNDVKKRAIDIQSVFTMFEQLFHLKKIKEEKMNQHVKNLQNTIANLEAENEGFHLKEEEIFLLKKQLRERDSKLSKLNIRYQ